MTGKPVRRTDTTWEKFSVIVGVLLSLALYQNSIQAAVGSIKAQFTAANGAATYTIPIEVPPGTAGMQPEVSLIYNSMSGPGIAGMGWSLTGSSAITRCGKTIFEDGAFAGVEYDYTDKFCLDGQRLVLVNGVYGQPGAEYRTKIDSFSRIRSYGTTGDGPQYFIVESKAGQTFEYGKTNDSRIIASGKSEAFAWALNKVSDISSNYMTYTYSGNPSGDSVGNPSITEFYLDKIEYSGNGVAGTAPYASVEFSYVSRNDKPVSYINGAKFQTRKLLKTITSKYGIDTAFDYSLIYKHRDNERTSLLLRVEQAANDGSTLPGTTFFWEETPETFESNSPQSWATSFPDNGNSEQHNFVTGDINGDGLVDIMSTGNAPEKIFHSTGTSFVEVASFGRCNNCKLGDVNGDGKADLIQQITTPFSSTLKVAYSNGTTFGSFVTISNSYPYRRERDSEWGWNYYPYSYDVGDVNGDGRADVVTTYRSGGNYIYFSNEDGGFSVSSSTACAGIKCLLGDVNGDGRADLIAQAITIGPDVKVSVATSNGSGFNGFASWNSEAQPGKSWMDFDVSDINGDGLADLVIAVEGSSAYSNTVLFQKSTGGSFETQPNLLGNMVLGTGSYKYMDVNADGLVDRLFTSSLIMVKTSPYSKPDHIKEILSGSGSAIRIGYGKLTSESVHQMDEYNVHPIYPVRSPVLLVTSTEQSNGIGGFSKSTFTYKGLNAHVHGIGSLGFKEIVGVNVQTGSKEVEGFSQIYPHIGEVLSSKVYKGGILVSESKQVPQYNSVSHPSGNLTINPFIERSDSIEYDLVSAQEYKRVITEISGSDIDQYGNVEKIITKTKSPESTEAVPELIIENINIYKAPVIDTDTWQLGRLDNSIVRKTNSDGVTKERESAFTYYPSGLLESEIIAPGALDNCTNVNRHECIKKTTTYLYDDYGNKKRATISGYGLAQDRYTETKYDDNGRFPEWTKNTLGHKEDYSHNQICGKKESLTGPNGLLTSWSYDAFCRSTGEIRADGTNTTIERVSVLDSNVYSVRPDGVSQSVELYPLANVAYKILTTESGKPDVTVYFDRLGRELRNKTVGFNNRIVLQDTEYDNLGRIAKASRSYYEGDAIYWVKFQYDELGRVTQQDAPTDYNARALTKTSYDGLVTTVTDPLGRITTTTKDVLEHVIRVDQPGGAFTINRYDPYGNLEETEDVKGNIVKMTYDDRGRKLTMDDPDMGYWEYGYNAVDELIWQKDAKSQEVTLEYDVLGRMKLRSEDEGDTRWYYDTQPNGVGKLASVSAPNGYLKEVWYNPEGRVDTTKTTINGQPYSISTIYDEAGRVKSVTRPGDFIVENVYDDNGYLLAKRSPANQVTDYDKAHLESLKDLAITSASDALAKAQQYATDAAYYEQWADTYRNEVAQNANVQYLTAEVAALQRHKSYRLYTHQNTGDLYLESPDRVMILHAEIDTPIMIPPAAHYQVVPGTDSEWTLQAVDLDTWATTVLPSLADSGEHVFFGDYNGDGKTDYIRNNQNVENPLYDSALLERLAQTASEIKYVANTLWSLADNALVRANQLIAVAGQVEDRQRQTELWVENSDGDDLNEMSDSASGAITYWQANTRDAEHRLTGFRQGNGLVTLRDYDSASGHLMSIQTGYGFDSDNNYQNGYGYGGTIRELEYHYDALDNVTSRHDRVQNVSESFVYDSLDRLKKNSVSGSLNGVSYSYSTDYEYDLTGNIRYKSDVGNYTYGSANRGSNNAGPAALVSAGPSHTGYQYDLNGNLESGGGRVFQWTSFNKPKLMEKGTTSVEFTYGPDRARFLKETGDETTVYVGKLYEEITEGSKTTHKHFIYAGGELAAIQIKTVDSVEGVQPDKTRYMHTDALGSVDTITDGFGNIVERMGFDPFGMRRGGNWNQGLPLELSAFTNRGFTGHEHVDDLGIIHMNGRIYDPELGRFLSADPHIQSPLNSQSHNRYSYVWNNPLKYTDPSGYFIKWVFKKIHKFMNRWGRTIAVAMMSWGVGWMGFFVGGQSVAVAGAFGGFIGGAAATGTVSGALKGAFFGAISAWTANQIGYGYFKDFTNVDKVVLHGMSQGLISQVSGGDFVSGFIGGALGKIAGSQMDFKNRNPLQIAKRTIVSSVVGGTAAKIGGGKFANGAVSAAFVHLFNDEAAEWDESWSRVDESKLEGTRTIDFEFGYAKKVLKYGYFHEDKWGYTLSAGAQASVVAGYSTDRILSFGFQGKVGLEASDSFGRGYGTTLKGSWIPQGDPVGGGGNILLNGKSMYQGWRRPEYNIYSKDTYGFGKFYIQTTYRDKTYRD